MVTTIDRWQNWAGNQSARPRRVITPRSAEEVAEAVKLATLDGLRVRMAGSGHSFTPVAVTDGVLLRPGGLRAVRTVDEVAGQVTVEAGCPLRVLNEYLASGGLALANMGDIQEQTVAGAIQTGTHGTGRDLGSIAAQVTALELVRADGSIVTTAADSDPALFQAARVGLGALGVLTAVTFQVVPAFLLEAREEPMRWAEVISRLDELTSDNEHFEFYWFPHTDGCLTKRNNRTEGPARPLPGWRYRLDDEFLSNTVFGATCRLGQRYPGTIPVINSIAGKALGARRYVDTSHKVFTSPRRVRFKEQEYAIPREHLAGALAEIRGLFSRHEWRISFPIEVRVAPADDIWLSTASGRPTAYIAIHVFHRAAHEEYFRAVEEVLTAVGGRPHWGKLHTRDADYLHGVYPGLANFVTLRDELDPARRFSNRYLEQVLGS
jgi:L-gulono-1,4-lactone dehydrogenase